MIEFLGTPAGIAVFCVVAVAVVLILIELYYKSFAKLFLDFLFALIATVVCSPVLLVCALLSKRNGEEGNALESRPFLGRKGKIVYLHAFAGLNGKIRYLARLFDVLGGRLSFVGVKPLSVEDGALIDDEEMERFNARPGILSHLVLGGNREPTYGEMFARDAAYARRRELFYDFAIVATHAVLALRGERKLKGETTEGGYCDALLARGVITEEEAARARAFAEEALAEDNQAKQFRKERYGRR